MGHTLTKRLAESIPPLMPVAEKYYGEPTEAGRQFFKNAVLIDGIFVERAKVECAFDPNKIGISFSKK